jgi:hypothetical protein
MILKQALEVAGASVGLQFYSERDAAQIRSEESTDPPTLASFLNLSIYVHDKVRMPVTARASNNFLEFGPPQLDVVDLLKQDIHNCSWIGRGGGELQ